MRPLYIYISLFFFVACIMAPSVLVINDLKAKESKVAKLFDMEEEDDTRDNDSETEKETDSPEKIFNLFFTAIIIPELIDTRLIHCHFYQQFLSEPARELVTPPPRG
jgi:hypothetical protein